MTSPRHWALVPAAGVGARMGADIPKQYLPLAGRPLLAHTLECLAGHPRIAGVVVVLGRDDHWFTDLRWDGAAPVRTAGGGPERCHSVLNGLAALAGMEAGASDWVLVHDAARPCLRADDIDRLMDALADHPVGGLLGLPVRDTMKRTDAHDDIVDTVSREHLWHALTPQMFRLGALREALRAVIDGGGLVTDEAQAMELAGHRPRLVEGSPDNIKVTHPEDLALAELFLAGQRRERP